MFLWTAVNAAMFVLQQVHWQSADDDDDDACLCFLCFSALQGSLDVVLTAKMTGASIPELVFLNSDVTADTCFLKVTGEQTVKYLV